ncbi:MAG: TIGR01777 family oxidoreductase [Fimbriimonadaceae bacterium]
MADPGRIVIAGGTGLIGTALIEHFQKFGHEVVVLTHTHGKAKRGVHAEYWDGKSQGVWASQLEGAEAVINLSGSPIAVLWTPANRKQILESRVNPTRAIGEAIANLQSPPKVWLNASAIGFYGNTGSRQVDEGAGPGPNFLGDTCLKWERAMDAFPTPNTRKVRLRFGQVLAREGGYLPPMVRLTSLFLGGSAGNGQQYVSWVHIRDVCKMTRWALNEEGIEGPLNVTGPLPVTNGTFMRTLRRVVGRPYCPPIPGFMIYLASQFNHVESALVLEGQNVTPAKALNNGFKFEFLNVEQALQNLV